MGSEHQRGINVPHYWTADQVKRLLDALVSHNRHQARTAALIMWRTGLRVSEVLELEWRELDYTGIRRRCSSGSRRAGAFGYRGRRLVVIVIPDPDSPDPDDPGVDDPGVDLPPLGVEALTPVAVIRSAEDLPGPGLVHLAQLPDRGVQRFLILHLQSVGAHRQDANTYVHSYGRAGLHRRDRLAVLDAEAGEPLASGVRDHLWPKTLWSGFDLPGCLNTER